MMRFIEFWVGFYLFRGWDFGNFWAGFWLLAKNFGVKFRWRNLGDFGLLIFKNFSVNFGKKIAPKFRQNPAPKFSPNSQNLAKNSPPNFTAQKFQIKPKIFHHKIKTPQNKNAPKFTPNFSPLNKISPKFPPKFKGQKC